MAGRVVEMKRVHSKEYTCYYASLLRRRTLRAGC